MNDRPAMNEMTGAPAGTGIAISVFLARCT
jgi:hypothetical protein